MIAIWPSPSGTCSAQFPLASCHARGRRPDSRAIGSGNIGATNVLRTGHKALAAATLLCDMLKGAVAVLAAGALRS